jgi:hypothetical protein
MASQKNPNKLTAKQASFVEYYTEPGQEGFNNALKACLLAGYSAKYADCKGGALVRNSKVNAAIKAKRQVIAKEWDWNREQNLIHHRKQIARYEAILAKNPDNIQAIQGLEQVYRELNASSGQHSSTVNTNNKTLAINVVARSSLQDAPQGPKQGDR